MKQPMPNNIDSRDKIRGEWWTWYFFFLDGLRGASTTPPNTAPLRSPTT